MYCITQQVRIGLNLDVYSLHAFTQHNFDCSSRNIYSHGDQSGCTTPPCIDTTQFWLQHKEASMPQACKLCLIFLEIGKLFVKGYIKEILFVDRDIMCKPFHGFPLLSIASILAVPQDFT